MADPVTLKDIERAAKSERDYVDGKFAVVTQRIDGMDKASNVLNETVTRVPTEVQRAVGGLKEVLAEKFESVDKQFIAAKEAVTKAEIATEKRFDEIDKSRKVMVDQASEFVARPEYNASQKALVDKVDTLTTRFERNEGQGAGLKMGWGFLVAGVGLLATIIALLAR